MACNICFRKSISKTDYDRLFGFEKYRQELEYRQEVNNKEQIEDLKTKISEQVNKHLGKSKNDRKILHWDKNPKKGCKNGKLLNSRYAPWKDNSDYIDKINKYFDQQLMLGNKIRNFDNIDSEEKIAILKQMKKMIDNLEQKQVQDKNKPSQSFSICHSNKELDEYPGKQAQNNYTYFRNNIIPPKGMY